MGAIIDGYRLDVSVSERPTYRSSITDHPVEKGANVTDHVRNDPIVLTVEGIVSDTPVGEVADERVQSGETGLASAFPSEDALSHFERLRLNREPVTVETYRRTYENMVLEEFIPPDDARTGDALRFTATLKQVVIVESERKFVRVADPRAKRGSKRGHKASPKVDREAQVQGVIDNFTPSADAKKDASILHKLFN